MRWFLQAFAMCLLASVISVAGVAQQPSVADQRASRLKVALGDSEPNVSATLTRYYDPQTGVLSADIVRRALQSNGELAAVRLDVQRARARLRQAGLRANPTLDIEQSTGKIVGSTGESETSIRISLPLELGGRRHRRVELAQAELEAIEAEVADRERWLTGEVLAIYTEALAALREFEITEGLTNIDLETTRFIQARVNEGETAPLELNLLRVEVDRLRSRRALIEGRLQAALVRLKMVAGIPPGEPLRLREEITSPSLLPLPSSLETAVEIALRTRPDLRLARLNEEVAQAGLQLSIAQSRPDVSISTRYSLSRSVFDNTPVGTLRDRDNAVTFGASINIPVFNRNQGTKEEAATAIVQARRRREFAESVVRAEVTSAYLRYEAASSALQTFEQGVIERSNNNIRAIRAAYEMGELRITDLLVEQRRLIDAQRDFTETLVERYRALSDLRLAIGTPFNSREESKQK